MTFWDNIVSQIEDISNYAVRYKVRHSFRSICEPLVSLIWLSYSQLYHLKKLNASLWIYEV